MDRSADWRRVPGQGRYAHRELERRFLVTPPLPAPAAGPRLIEDRYLDGTRLRLRRVSGGGEQMWKLAQKVRVDDDRPDVVALTNIYLSEAEYDALAVLPATTVTKTREVHPVGAVMFAVDTFHGHLEGLRLAEVEVTDVALALPAAPWLGREVSTDDRFSGGRLASATPAEVAALLCEVGTDDGA